MFLIVAMINVNIVDRCSANSEMNKPTDSMHSPRYKCVNLTKCVSVGR